MSFASLTANGSSRSPLETPGSSNTLLSLLPIVCNFPHSKATTCRYNLHCNKHTCSSTHKELKKLLGSHPVSFSPPPPAQPMSPRPWMFPEMGTNMFPTQWNNQIRSNNQNKNETNSKRSGGEGGGC